MIQAAIYARVSHTDGRESVLTQLEKLHDHAKREGMTIVEEYKDLDISGGDAMDTRPEGKRLLRDAQAGRFEVLLIYKLDRLSRDLLDQLVVQRTLERYGVRLISITESFDVEDPSGTFLFQINGAAAQFERAKIRERARDGLHRTAGNGKFTGGKAPLGYMVKDRTLVPSDRIVESMGITEAQMVRELFDRVAAGSTCLAETQRMNGFGFKWQTGRLRYVLKNRTYLGEYHLRTRNKAGEVVRETRRRIPPLVTVEVFNKVQAQLKANRSRPPNRKTSRNWLLSGLLKCGICDRSFTGTYVPSNGHRYTYYKCTGNQTAAHPVPSERCGVPHVHAEKAEAAVWNIVKDLVLNHEATIQRMHQQLEEKLRPLLGSGVAAERLHKRIASKVAEKQQVLISFDERLRTLEEVRDRVTTINGEIGSLKAELEAIHSEAEMMGIYKRLIDDKAAFLESVADQLRLIEAGEAMVDVNPEDIVTLPDGVSLDDPMMPWNTAGYMVGDFKRDLIHAVVDRITVAKDRTLYVSMLTGDKTNLVLGGQSVGRMSSASSSNATAT